MSFEIGDYVMKSMTGLCKVDKIMNLDMDGIPRDKLFYLLEPLEEKRERIYVPVETATNSLRKCMTQDEAWSLIRQVGEIKEIWIDNEKLREQRYRDAIKTNDPKELVSVIKVIYQRRTKRFKQGKKSISGDERYFLMAENLLHSELGFALDKSKEEISRLIADYVERNDIGQKESC